MMVAAMSGTHTRAMIKATPTRNWAMLAETNALEVYRKDANRGWTAFLSATTSTPTRRTPASTVKYG